MSSDKFTKGTPDYLGAEIYSDTQKLTDQKDAYISYQEALRPDRYMEKNKLKFTFSELIRKTFPFISGLTLISLALFLALPVEKILYGEVSISEWFLGIITLSIGILIIALNELFKSRALSYVWKHKAKRFKPERTAVITAIVASSISIIGSCIGIYLTSYQLNDESNKIKTGDTAQKIMIANEYSIDSVNIVQNYQPIIDQKKESISRFDPRKYRTKRDQLNGEVILLTRTMREELNQLKKTKIQSELSLQTSTSNLLEDNKKSAAKNSWIAMIMILLGEIGYIFSHRYGWIYRARSTKEGIEFGAIENIDEKTAYEIKMERIAAYLGSIQKNSSGLIGIPAINTHPGSAAPTPGKVGFSRKPTSEKDVDVDSIIAGLANIIENYKSAGKSPGKTTKSAHGIILKKKEIELNNTHPKFSKKVQPVRYRGIDDKKYRRFLKAAKEVLKEEKKYNKKLIAIRAGIDRGSVAKYLNTAFEKKELEE